MPHALINAIDFSAGTFHTKSRSQALAQAHALVNDAKRAPVNHCVAQVSACSHECETCGAHAPHRPADGAVLTAARAMLSATNERGDASATAHVAAAPRQSLHPRPVDHSEHHRAAAGAATMSTGPAAIDPAKSATGAAGGDDPLAFGRATFTSYRSIVARGGERALAIALTVVFTAGATGGCIMVYVMQPSAWYFGTYIVLLYGTQALSTAYLAANAPPPELIDALQQFPALLAEAPRVVKKGHKIIWANAVSWTVQSVLFVTFVAGGGMADRGMRHDDEWLLWLMSALVCSVPMVLLLTAPRMPLANRAFFVYFVVNEGVTTAAKSFADAVERGMPGRVVYPELLKLRRLLQMSQSYGLFASVLHVLIPFALVVLAVLLFVDTSPPLFFLIQGPMLLHWVFVTAHPAAAVMEHVLRVPRILAERATRHTALVKSNSRRGGTKATSWAQPSEGGSEEKLPPSVLGAAGQPPGAEMLSDAGDDASDFDVLLVRWEHLRIGWFMFGMPMTKGLVSRMRALLVPLLGLVIREVVQLQRA